MPRFRVVARLLDCYLLTKTQQVCLVMERYKLDLDDPARAKVFEAFPVGKLIVIRQLVEALRYLRECRIIHADIKPSNVLISKQGVLRLCDFGLAKLLGPNENYATVEQIRGSPEYMAPELLEKGLQYDYSVDVWSLGTLL